MTRRDIIKTLGMVSLHAMFPAVLSGFLASCKNGTANEKKLTFFHDDEQDVIKATVDIILPATKSASASAVGVHNFLDDVFTACLNDDQRKLIRDGLKVFTFQWKDQDDKIKFVTMIDREAYDGKEEFAWFKIVKQCTLIGFFTSQEGTTRAGDYQKIPDKFIGEVPATENTLAHSVTALRISL